MHSEGILWRRLDTPGHDACRMLQQESGWRLEGSAAYRHETGAPACIVYEVECDFSWRTRGAVVQGWVGERRIDLRIYRTPDGDWLLDGQVVAKLDKCVDLDLGFTPATNLFQLRRVALQVGETADFSVAWLDVPGGAIDVLAQRYKRRSIREYWYEAPRFDYAALLQVNPAGFVEQYPGLWEAEQSGVQQHFEEGPGNPGRF